MSFRRNYSWLHWCSAYISLQVMLCIRMLDIRCSLADLQQFFTGKLYVLMYQLKLPAEELLWLAIPCTEDTSTPPPRSDMKITRLKIQALTIIHILKKNRIVTQGLKILLLMQHVHVTGFTPWHLLYHVTIILHHGSHLSLRVSLRDGSAAQRLFLMTCYCKVVVQYWHSCKFLLACISPKTHFRRVIFFHLFQFNFECLNKLPCEKLSSWC